ncbi:hypothetical protein E3N88_45758 [Mikania micrantha]|uniref:Uncharacterized protein n=1 Tax=Mikania micrantha TaxID=192012 RepID=A0A5N6LAK5_9ASTR|nr:hypothetical protein E3N88_45758 [Mikania micrantha]
MESYYDNEPESDFGLYILYLPSLEIDKPGGDVAYVKPERMQPLVLMDLDPGSARLAIAILGPPKIATEGETQRNCNINHEKKGQPYLGDALQKGETLEEEIW